MPPKKDTRTSAQRQSHRGGGMSDAAYTKEMEVKAEILKDHEKLLKKIENRFDSLNEAAKEQGIK